MTFCIELTAPGGVENLSLVRKRVGAPGFGEIRMRQRTAGVNFIDIYQRTGLYPLPLPAILGVEGVGEVEAIGEGVEGISVGDRVGYAGIPGGYAQRRLLPAWRAIPLPQTLPDAVAASGLLRAFTAHMLLKTTYNVTDGTNLLIHAGAGGLSSLVIPWAKRMGARVMTTTSSEAKAARAIKNGADQVIVGRNADIAKEVLAWTEGRGADYVIDGIGGPTFFASLNATAKFGMVASVGQAGGPIAPVCVEDLGPMRSLSFSRPSVMAYLANQARYKAVMPEIVEALSIGDGQFVGPQFDLKEAAAAQAALEDGTTMGAPVLLT